MPRWKTGLTIYCEYCRVKHTMVEGTCSECGRFDILMPQYFYPLDLCRQVYVCIHCYESAVTKFWNRESSKKANTSEIEFVEKSISY